MRKVILFIASSLDMFIARKDGSVDWLFTDGDYGYRKFYESVDTVLMGRKTYELALKLGDSFGGKNCVVFSRSAGRKAKGNVKFASDPASFTEKLRAAPGKDIYLVGGGQIVSALLNAGLVDEIVLSIHPIILGTGIPLFDSIGKSVKLSLEGSEKFPSGLVQLKYSVAKAAF
ncbi:MAG TPA: dihydrofolate reductase family protein [Candidatus Bilamarchaeum sp.]|nr:dihydrofolate reductase family protein [Candidatus Bilamarchaeum sp.]